MRAARDVLRRPVPAATALIAVLFGLSLAMSTGGYLGTDTGAKVATLQVMEDRGTARPVLGYWAEDLDPDGNLHPIYGSELVEGEWVHVTTLPMLELARPLWSLGGYRATLLLPILGAVGTAFACRSLARRAAGERAGWQTFWLVGLGSPITVYALDLWEHAPGVACMAGAIALLVSIVDGDRPATGRAITAGFLLGAAASMRTEAFVYSFTAVGASCLVIALHQRERALAIWTGALSSCGFAAAWLANAGLDSWLGGNARGERVSGAAGGGLDRYTERVEEALITLLALRPGSLAEVVVIGGMAAALVAGALVADQRGDQRLGVVLLAGSAAVHVLVVAGGLGFVPGMLSAAPLVIAAILLLPEGTGSRTAVGISVASLPLVWAFQFVGGARPQWAGRYALTSCLVLVALGIAGLQRATPVVRRALFGLAGAVTCTGLLWLSERSHDIERLFDELVERPEDVIVARNGFFIREGGARYVDRRWLVAVSDDDLEEAARVVRGAGLTTFAVLDQSPRAPERIGEAAHTGDDRAEVLGIQLFLHSYAL